MVLIWCSSVKLKQPYHMRLRHPNGAHTILRLPSEWFPLRGTFHPPSLPENHLLTLRTHLERYSSLCTPRAASAKTLSVVTLSAQFFSSTRA